MRIARLCVLFIVVAGLAPSQTVPEILYYRFNEGSGTTAVNSAFPGAGLPTGTLYGSAAFGTGRFGTGLSCTGQTGSLQGMTTGYTLGMQGQSWSLEFWLNPNASTTSIKYMFGVPVGLALRCFNGAVPGNGNITFTGSGLGTVNAVGAAPAAGVWVHVAFVFDNSTAPPTVTPYVNGVGQSPVAQTGALTLNTGTLNLGSQLTGSAGLDGTIDEFRLWGHALTPAEIVARYNIEVYPFNILSAQTSGAGTGDLNLAMTSVSPGATEGYLLLTTSTAGAVGTGPLMGIVPDALTWSIFSQPLVAGSPLHYPVGVPGVFPDQPFTVPAGTLGFLAGQVWDVVGIVLAPGFAYLGASNVQRLAW